MADQSAAVTESRDLHEFSDDELPHAPASLTERRRAQKAKFEEWLTSTDILEALKPKAKNVDAKEAADEQLSIEKLMAKQGAEIIKNPREYQWELFQRAQKSNTIAVLDTGSGKTLIAVLLLKWIIDVELERRATGEQPQIAFFLVASVTLVYQQLAVLQQNLDHPVARVCGADGVDNWSKARWMKLFVENKVIVATADVLHACLAHSFISMKQISLLIFDEAHHAKKNHAYARIVKDFYLSEDEGRRPRIFGMTASPIDAKTDVVQAASELESLLHSQIATTADMSLVEAVKKPKEHVFQYDALPTTGSETDFLRSIKTRFAVPAMFDGICRQSVEISRHLGRWCADLYLANALSERKLPQYELEADRKYYYRDGGKRDSPMLSENEDSISTSRRTPIEIAVGSNISQLDKRQAVIRAIIAFVESEQSKHAAIRNETDFSPKVLGLKRFLAPEFETPSSRRCIVFVERRHTARLLSATFKRFGVPNLRPGFLVGANNPEMDEDNFTTPMQVLTMAKFRSGEINCLFCTTVAEEGLDIPDCNLVIRFDMYRTMIQYVQSRGRARQRNSKFLHMVEKGNSVHAELLLQVRAQERAMRRFCQLLPENRRLYGNEGILETLMTKEKALRTYIEESTGTKLTYGNALVCLANFISSIPTDTDDMLQPTYIVNSHGEKFVAEVLLPGNAPIRSAIGKVCTKKLLAKCSAAWEACRELRRKEYLDEHLMPIYQKKLPAMRNALLAVNMKTTNMYVMKTKPSMWEQTRGTLPSKLYVSMIDFPDGLEHPNRPLALLTRPPMPHFPAFPVFLTDGRPSSVRSSVFDQPIGVNEQQLDKLSAFTYRIFKDVFSKTYDYQPAHLSYWLGPAKAGLELSKMSGNAQNFEASNAIDWALVDEVFTHEEYKWTPGADSNFLVDKFVVDSWDGSRKFFSIAVCRDMKPLDPVPPDTAKAKWDANILEYSNSLFKQARARREGTWNLDQPVLEAVKILLRRNMLATPEKKELTLRTKAFLCPEPLRISALPPAVATSCFAWPAIIHRLESYLIALEASKMIGVDCSPQMALAAMTKDSDNSGDHDKQEHINFQHGMGENYERLEFIGDTFLKTATSISTFIQNPNDNEFEFHVKRMLMLCNQNLFNVAKELKLYEYVRSIAFSRRLWYPEGLKLLEGKGANKQEETSVIKHSLGEKTIADVCEALIGAAYVTHDRPGDQWQPSHWENAVRAVTRLVNSADHTMLTWSDYIAAYEKPSYQTGEVSASQRDLAEKVEREHPYHFKYPRLLRSAFIHPSQPVMYEKVPNYQRLEFLGDALLDMASIAYLFHRYPDRDPQWLTEHKMAMVSNKFLGAVCVNVGFHLHLRHSSAILQHQIADYAIELLETKRVAGDAKDYWTTVSDPPKCLPDIVEAYVGAAFIDSNFDYNVSSTMGNFTHNLVWDAANLATINVQVVRDFFDMHIKGYFEDMSIYDTFANNHPCTHLHNLLQQTYACQEYRLMAKELPSVDTVDRKDVVAAVMVHDEVVAFSKGRSGRYARLRAAQMAIEVIDGLAPFEFRSRFGCDCTLMETAEKETVNNAAHADCNV
ncbi:hypothetical protein BAUCODRAFT_570103 [Baudoinia panamericana UAMH 10762]|uniref:Dicer-like protein 1 n=1 Tax=Baudoinia panamericana (strain UAMH 10762) TaxID=717646 RepID=M2LC79_BAUPA|nr:uncharacterized protein BAUCODRAFT_570103 [Baudoinia panamericana UAMH 10762]EMC91542.1 hypothetical protein BAUCODRAFT_570103 [Baudoinia panamericana UAMH 10762]